MSVVCLGAVVFSTSSCRVWSWMWEAETETVVSTEDLVVGGQTAANGFVAVEYDRAVVHEGTDIYYANQGNQAHRIIVIDAGHQSKADNDTEPVGPGSDTMKAKVASGTTGVSTGTPEHELNLKVALALRDELYARGYSVVMIRETADVSISNKERAELANKYNAAAYIRIHGNGVDNPEVNGAETICQSADNPYPTCASMYTSSRMLSEAVLEAFCQATDMRQRKVSERDDMTGINWACVPSTIIEMGFMSNPEEDRKMSGTYFLGRAAEGIANGIQAYFAALDAEV